MYTLSTPGLRMTESVMTHIQAKIPSPKNGLRPFPKWVTESPKMLFWHSIQGVTLIIPTREHGPPGNMAHQMASLNTLVFKITDRLIASNTLVLDYLLVIVLGSKW